MALCWLSLMSLSLAAAEPGDARFVRAGVDTQKPVWGLRDGLRFAVWPADVAGGERDGGPRGLLRIGYPTLPDGGYALINFIAVEPIVRGQQQRAFSELEPSADGRPGKLISADGLDPGRLEPLPDGHARLVIDLSVERFASGAHVRLRAVMRTDRPDELALQTFAEDDSAPLAACVLTATMGNLERLRELHLAGRVATAAELYADWTGDEFAPHRSFPLAELTRTPDGGVLVAATTDEADPGAVLPDPARPWFWRYRGRKVTQYWRKPPGEFDDTLRAQVNARRHYWMSRWPIPGGVAFENFELVERFRPGRITIFGLTLNPPA